MRICLCLFFCLSFFASLHTVQADETCNDHIVASTPDSQLIDNGNGTITDSKTGLMWKQCLEGLSGSNCESGTPIYFDNWQAALKQPRVINNNSGFAGYHDWRLPNIKELRSIVEVKCGSINHVRFPNNGYMCWSGSPCAYFSSFDPLYYYAWIVDFSRWGESSCIYRNSYGYDAPHVRLVRDGR